MNYRLGQLGVGILIVTLSICSAAGARAQDAVRSTTLAIGQVGQRVTRGGAAQAGGVHGRIQSRIQNRVQLRINNRINRTSSVQSDAAVSIKKADNNIRK